MDTSPTTLDPQVVNLTKAIRQTESGGDFQAQGKSGEYGAYQWTPGTWASESQKYLGQSVPLQQATPQQQNEVAYKKIADWKAQGYNVGQIASMWNAGEGNPNAYITGNKGVNKEGVAYDTGAYAKSVATAYQKIKGGGQASQDPNNPSSTGSAGIGVLPNSSQPTTGQNIPGIGTLPQTNVVPPATPTPTPTPAPPQSLMQKLNSGVKNFGTAMGNFGEGLLNPFARLGVSAYNDVAAPVGALGALMHGGNALQAFNQQASAPRNIGFTGGATTPYLPTSQPSGAPLTNEQAVRQGLSAAGGAAQIGSNFIGGGGAAGLAEDAGKQTLGASIYQGAKTGLQAGGLFGLGSGLQDPNATPSSVAQQTAIGAGAGTVGGGLIGGILGKAQLMAGSSEQDAWDTIQPKGKNVDPASLQYKNTATGKVAASVPTSEYDQKMIQATLPYKPTPSDPIGSWQRITAGVEEQASALRKAINPNQGFWSPDNYQSVIKSVEVPIGAKGEASASQVQGIQDYLMNLTTDADKHTVGTLDVSRGFRQGINDAYGENIWDKDTAIAQYIRNINKAINNFTASKLPAGALSDGTPFADAMQNISLLLTARDNIAMPKVGAQTSTNALGLLQGLAKKTARPVMEGMGFGAFTHLIP